MKLGDFVLNKKIMREAEENLKNLTDEQREDMILVTKGSAFIATSMIELLESDTFVQTNRDEKVLSDILLKMIGTGVALGILHIATRANKPEIVIKLFKHYFESVTENFLQVKNDNN